MGLTPRSSWGTKRSQILKRSHASEPDEIAEQFGMTVAEVEAVLASSGMRRVPAVVIEAKTGKVSHHQSFRSAYIHICIKGLTDWSWHTKADYDAWVAVNAGAA